MTPRTRLLTLIFALTGLGCSITAAWVHYRLIVDPTYVSPCDINATFNCSQVYLSRFGTVAHVPVALGGVLFFALVSLIAAGARSDKADPDCTASAYVFALSTIGLAVVLYFGYASSVILKTFCVLCLGTYASVIALFIATGFARTNVRPVEIPMSALRDLRDLKNRPLWFLIAILFLGGSAALLAFFPREGTVSAEPVSSAASIASGAPQTAETQFLDAWGKQPRIDLGIPADGAKVVVVKFNDWQCPACKAAHLAYAPILDRFEKEHPGAVKYVLKDFPLNAKCNVTITDGPGPHPAACEAAVAMRLARAKGKADPLMDYIYDHQEELTPEMVKSAAESIAGITDFDHQYELTIPDVKKDVSAGAVLHVGRTPTFYINGVMAADAEGRILPPKYFDLVLQYEIVRASSPSAAPIK